MIKKEEIPIVEVFLSAISIWWAFVLFHQPGGLDSRLPRYMEHLGAVHEYGWGFIFLIGALVKVYGIISRRTSWRKAGLIISMILYSLICTGFILSNNTIATGTGVYFLMTVLAWWGFREVKEYGDQQ